MNYSKIALGNAIGIIVFFFVGLSLLGIPLSLVAIGTGFKGLKQKKITKNNKIFSWIGIAGGVFYLLFSILGFVLFYAGF